MKHEERAEFDPQSIVILSGASDDDDAGVIVIDDDDDDDDDGNWEVDELHADDDDE